MSTWLLRDALPLLIGVSVPLAMVGWRWLLAGVIFGLLYRVLADPKEGNRPNLVRRIGFAFLGALVVFNLTARWVQAEQPSAETGRAFQAYYMGVVQYRMSFTPLGEASAAIPPRTEAIRELREAVRLAPESVVFRRHLGVALAEQGDYREALSQLLQSAKLLETRNPGRAARERQVWRSLYGADPPTQGQIQRANRELDQLGLGWIGKVAVQAAYERFGADAVPDELRQEVRGGAARYARRLIITLFGMTFFLAQLALVVVVVAGVWIWTGVLKPVPRRQHPVCPILWEGFILMMAISLAPVLLFFGGKRPSPETQPALVALLLLAYDVLQIGAVAYMAWRLRGRGLRLAEIGLTPRHFWSNVGIGIAAAVVLIPLTFLVASLSQWLGKTFFPNIAPPYHPVQGMTATSANPLIRAAIFAAAAIGAPLLEEIFFRGALYGALRRRYGIWAGVLLSSAFFSLLHPQLPLGFVPIAFLGAGFCLLYEWRQSLVPGIVAHAINNGLVFLILSTVFPPRG